MILHGNGFPCFEKKTTVALSHAVIGQMRKAPPRPKPGGTRVPAAPTKPTLVFQSIVPADGIMLPIGRAETSVRHRFLGS